MFLEPEIENTLQTGSIEVICGSMFSGKTEELIRRLNKAKFAKLKTAVFKPKTDVRYDKQQVVSHNSNTVKSRAVDSALEILDYVKDIDVVAVDEVQFFSIEILDVCEKLANKNKRVILAGLDMDFLGNPFGSMPQLLAIAEHVTKVHAICSDCGKMASHSFRFSNNKDLIELGQKKEYKPLCRSCFKKNLK
jgi:thymidine kinase